MTASNTGVSGDLGATEVHEVLGNDRRRLALAHLRARLGRASVADLADAVAREEAGEHPSRGLRESVYNSLHQTHLPTLESRGVVTYDRETKEVSLRPDARRVHAHTCVHAGFGVTWAELYRTLALCGFLALVFVEMDVPPFGLVDPLLYASCLLALLTLATGAQLWVQRWRYFRWLAD